MNTINSISVMSRAVVSHAVLTRSGLFIDEEYFANKGQIGKVKKSFTVTVIELKKYIKTMSLFKYSKVGGAKYVILPRHGGVKILKGLEKKLGLPPLIVDNQMMSGEPPKFTFTREGKFRGNQKIIFDHIMKNYFSPSMVSRGLASLILQLDTGQGKSYIGAALIAHLQVKTLIICHSTAVASDWIDKTLRGEFPNNVIGQYNGSSKKDGDIVVAIVNSLIMDDMKVLTNKSKKTYVKMTPTDFFSRFGLIIYDETQKYNSKSFSKVFWRAQAPYVIGLSATPSRHEFHKISKWGIGDVLDAKTIPGYSTKKSKFKGEVGMIKYHAPAKYSQLLLNEKLEILNVAATINMITEDPYRNSIIIDKMTELISEGLNIFVFSDRKAHLHELKAGLIENGKRYVKSIENPLTAHGIPKTVVALIRKYVFYCHSSILIGGGGSGKVGRERMEKAERFSNVILTTYPYMDTGKSIPKMNAIMLCTPRKNNSEQSIGRILRLGSDESTVRQIIDVVDWGTRLKNQWYTRKKFYTSRGYEIASTEYDCRDRFIGDARQDDCVVGSSIISKTKPVKNTTINSSEADNSDSESGSASESEEAIRERGKDMFKKYSAFLDQDSSGSD